MRFFIPFLLCSCTLAIADINYDAGVEKGRITFYAQSNYVACDIPESEWPQYTTALSEKHFQGGLACGATVRLMNGGKEIQVMVVDLCPVQGNEQWCSGDMTHFDLGNSTTFAQLEPPETGVKQITFEWIPTPVGDTPVKLRLKDGINPYWVAIEVINHRYPVAKLEIKDPQSGTWKTGDRTKPGMYNYWQFSFTGNGLVAPFQIRITDQYGQVIEETGSVVEEKYMWAGQNQFPLLPRHGGVKIVTPPVTQSFDRPVPFIVQNRLNSPSTSPVWARIFDPVGRMMGEMHLPAETASRALPVLPPGVYIVVVTADGIVSKLLWVKDAAN
jgi:expansin